MSRLWLWILIILGGAAAAVMILDATGVIDFSWQSISTGLAAIAGPFQFITNKYKDERKKVKDKYQKEREEEKAYQQELENRVKAREEKIQKLDKEITEIDQKIELVEHKKKQTVKEVNEMNSDELSAKARELFGD